MRATEMGPVPAWLFLLWSLQSSKAQEQVSSSVRVEMGEGPHAGSESVCGMSGSVSFLYHGTRLSLSVRLCASCSPNSWEEFQDADVL